MFWEQPAGTAGKPCLSQSLPLRSLPPAQAGKNLPYLPGVSSYMFCPCSACSSTGTWNLDERKRIGCVRAAKSQLVASTSHCTQTMRQQTVQGTLTLSLHLGRYTKTQRLARATGCNSIQALVRLRSHKLSGKDTSGQRKNSGPGHVEACFSWHYGESLLTSVMRPHVTAWNTNLSDRHGS